MYVGDFALGKTFDVKFCTVNTSGVPTTLAGSPVISAYPDNSVTELTAGITLTVDFDSRTGMHNIRVVASSGNGYATATNYALVITTGTVGGSSVVGYLVAHFSIEARSGLRPATADRTLVVDAAGLADANVVKQGPSGSGVTQTARDMGASVLLSAGTGTGQLDFTAGVVRASIQAAGDFAQGAADKVWSTTTRTLTAFGFSVTVGTNNDKTGYALSSAGIQAIWDALTSALTTVGSIGKRLADFITGDAFVRLGAPAGASVSADIAAVKTDTAAALTRLPAALVSGRMDASVGAMAANTVTASALDATAGAEIADAVWDELLSGHLTAGSAGAALNGAGSAGDPWTTTLPGAYGAGTAGFIVGTNLDAKVSSVGGASGGAYTAEYTAVTANTTDSDPGSNNLKWNNATQPSATFLYIDNLTQTSADASSLFARITAGARIYLQRKTDSAQFQQFTATGNAVDGTGYWKIPVVIVTSGGSAFAGSNVMIVQVTLAGSSAPSAGTVAAAVWDEALAGHATAGSAGKTLSDVWGVVDTEVAAIKAQTDQLGFTTGRVNAQVKAMDTDTVTSAALAASAVTEIQSGLATSAGLAAVPTATQNADALLTRDMGAVAGEASRSPLNAIRALRNMVDMVSTPGTMKVKKEDDVTDAWTAAVTTDAAANPITKVDPA